MLSVVRCHPVGARPTVVLLALVSRAARRLKRILVLHVHAPPNRVAVAHHNVGSHTRTLGCPLQRAGVYWQFFQPRTRAANAVKYGVVEGLLGGISSAACRAFVAAGCAAIAVTCRRAWEMAGQYGRPRARG